MTTIGRPSKIDDLDLHRWALIERGIKSGVPYKFVCGFAGISHPTWIAWMKKGSEESMDNLDTKHAAFFKRINSLECEYAVESAEIMSGNEKGHKGREWILARRHREEFHLSTKLEHTGKIDGDHAVTVFDGSALDQLDDVDDEEEDDE